MRIYVGYDARDDLAFRIFKRSLERHSSVNLEILPLIQRDLRKRGLYWRSYRVSDGHCTGEINGQCYDMTDGKPFSTEFSFTRFAVPMLENWGPERVVFADPDMLCRADIKQLMRDADDTKAVCCVQHRHVPDDGLKIDGVLQTRYDRKNWSSLMVIRPDLCRRMTQYALNRMSGQWLHALRWVDDEQIGSLPEEWNWLDGWSNPDIDPKIVHMTNGTPDMEGHENIPYADEWRAYLTWPTMMHEYQAEKRSA